MESASARVELEVHLSDFLRSAPNFVVERINYECSVSIFDLPA